MPAIARPMTIRGVLNLIGESLHVDAADAGCCTAPSHPGPERLRAGHCAPDDDTVRGPGDPDGHTPSQPFVIRAAFADPESDPGTDAGGQRSPSAAADRIPGCLRGR